MSESKKVSVKAVTVARILPRQPHHNQDYTAVLLKQQVFSGNLLSSGLENRTCIQNIHNNQMEQLGIVEGIDLCQVTDQELKLVITEIIQSEFTDLSENEQRSYRPKCYPGTDTQLANEDGEGIFRKVELGPASTPDVRVKHQRVSLNEVKAIQKQYAANNQQHRDAVAEAAITGGNTGAEGANQPQLEMQS